MSIEQEFADKLVQYKHIIYKVCFMYADNKDDVNDLFQESVFNIWKSYKNFRGESSFVTWVYRISLNTCISDFRKKKKYDYVPLEQQIDILEDCEHNELLKEMYSLIKRLNKVDIFFNFSFIRCSFIATLLRFVPVISAISSYKREIKKYVELVIIQLYGT